MDKSDFIGRHIIDNRDRLYRLALSYVKNEQDAMDVVQDVACKALKNAHRLKEPQFLDSWLYRVTINTSLDLLRQRRRELTAVPLPEEGRVDDYSQLDLQELLGLLDEKSRAVLILRFFEDRPILEISQILNENQNTVKTRLYRALRTLRQQLAE